MWKGTALTLKANPMVRRAIPAVRRPLEAVPPATLAPIRATFVLPVAPYTSAIP